MSIENTEPENSDDKTPDTKRNRMREILDYLIGDAEELPEGIELVEMGNGSESRRVLFSPDDEDGQAVARRAINAAHAAQGVPEKVVLKRESNVTASTADTIEDDVKNSLHIVDIKTDAFSSQAYGFYELPGTRVMEVLAMDEMKKMPEMIGLLKSALINPKKGDNLDILNFGELGEVLSQWIEISQPAYEKSILRGFRKH